VVAGSHILLITVHVKKGQSDLNEHYAQQRCTNLCCRVVRANKLYLPGVMTGVSVWNLLHSIVLTSRILRWLLDSWKVFAHVVYGK
jgi:hypothetical protein